MPSKFTQCEPWPGARTPRGYGKVCVQGRTIYVHRLAYALSRGLAIEDIAGLDVLHSCDNPPCRNPDHLFVGKQADNTADMVAKGRAWWLRHGRDARGRNMTMTEQRPEYVTVVTRAKIMAPGVHKLVLRAGHRGEKVGEVLARCQAGDDQVNWIIDSKGTVYELAGWEKATPDHPDAYVIHLVMPKSDAQEASLAWLTGQLARKKGVDSGDDQESVDQ